MATHKSKSAKSRGAGGKGLAIEKSAGAVVFRRTKPIHYLLIRSSYWEFPKGLIDAHESEQAAALREVREETGLEVTLVPDARETVRYFYRRKDGTLVKKEVVYFLGEAHSDKVTISWEHSEFRWVTPDAARELLEYESAREILDKADARVRALGRRD